MTDYVEFNQIIGGAVKYLNSEVMIGMNDWQKMLARMAVSRIIGNKDKVRDIIVNNPFVRTFGFVDENGYFDIDGIAHDLREQIADMGKLEISIPMFGTFRFSEADVDKLHRMIVEYR